MHFPILWWHTYNRKLESLTSRGMKLLYTSVWIADLSSHCRGAFLCYGRWPKAESIVLWTLSYGLDSIQAWLKIWSMQGTYQLFALQNLSLHSGCDEQLVLCTLEITDWDHKSLKSTNGYFWATFICIFIFCQFCGSPMLIRPNCRNISSFSHRRYYEYEVGHHFPSQRCSHTSYCSMMNWHWAPTVLEIGAGLWRRCLFAAGLENLAHWLQISNSPYFHGHLPSTQTDDTFSVSEFFDGSFIVLLTFITLLW